MNIITVYFIWKEAVNMLFWNKVEIYNGYSLEEFSQLRNTLAAAKIQYDYKLIDRNKSGDFNIVKSGYGSLGSKPDLVTRYYLYVHQKDYYQAMHLISNRNV
jgi:hypothetical protein